MGCRSMAGCVPRFDRSPSSAPLRRRWASRPPPPRPRGGNRRAISPGTGSSPAPSRPSRSMLSTLTDSSRRGHGVRAACSWATGDLLRGRRHGGELAARLRLDPGADLGSSDPGWQGELAEHRRSSAQAGDRGAVCHVPTEGLRRRGADNMDGYENGTGFPLTGVNSSVHQSVAAPWYGTWGWPCRRRTIPIRPPRWSRTPTEALHPAVQRGIRRARRRPSTPLRRASPCSMPRASLPCTPVSAHRWTGGIMGALFSLEPRWSTWKPRLG